MKIPLTYPKIPDSRNCPLKYCVAFEKYDGTNIYASYNTEHSVWAFGTRRDQFSLDEEGKKQFIIAHPGLEEVSELVEYRLSKHLGDYLINYKEGSYKEIKIFFEFLGDNSFAGQHRPNDNATLVTIDVMVDEKLLAPQVLIQDFSQFNLASIIYQGKYTGQFIEDVRKGKYSVDEGVVIKGLVKDQVYMIKVKTDAYMKRLQTEFKNNWKDYWE